MKLKSLLAIFITTSVFASSAVLADHKSPMGAGTANMPNDIHNTRIDTMDDETITLTYLPLDAKQTLTINDQ